MKPRFAPPRLGPLAFSILALSLCGTTRSQVFYNFDSGNDNGWTHLDPLAQFGAPTTFSFPNGGYRIQASASPDPANLGPGRAGSLRSDLNFANPLQFFDLVGWNDSLNQSIGLLGRVESPGFGTTKGYAFTYSTAGSITLSLLDNEHLTTLASKTVTLDPTKSYRLQFDCYGPILSGLVLQKGAWNPVAFVQVEDSTYGQGATGLYLFSNAGNGTADATFDNYEAVAAVPEPSTVSLLALAFAPLLWVKIWRRTGRKPVRGTTEQR